MRLEEANRRFNKLSGIRFKDLFSPADMQMITINKGKTGQLLELSLGMRLSNTNLDFEDGELKTNKCDADGNPRETVFITQISGVIDELITKRPFENTHLYEKISNILYVPVCKDGSPENWMFLPSIHIDLSKLEFAGLKDIWRNDYYSICDQIRNHLSTAPMGLYILLTGNTFKYVARMPETVRETIIQYSPIYMVGMYPTRIMPSILRSSLFMILEG